MEFHNNDLYTPLTDFVAIDVEYSSDEHYICQLGLAVVHNLIITEQRTWLVQPPGNSYGIHQTEVHGMTAATTVDSPTFDYVWQEIEPYLRDQQIWAHNASAVEQSVIEKNLNYYKIPHEPYIILDSIRLFPRRDRNGWNHGNSLRACLYAMGLPCDHHHDAGSDAAMCAQIIIALQQGIIPDWQLSDRLMQEYEMQQATIHTTEEHSFQTRQLDLFADVLSSSCNGDSHAPTFFHKNFDNAQDGTDNVDITRLNTADTNPVYGVNIVLTGFFHIARKQLRDALKKMGASLKQSITKNVQVVLIGERNAGASKISDLQTLIHNGYNIARICGDSDLDRLLYDATLTPADFAVPQVARKELNFTVKHFREHHHDLVYPLNTISGRELFFPSSGFMGRQDCFFQICGNLGAFGNWDYNPQVNLVVLPNSSVEALKRGEKDDVVLCFEAYYNSQRSVTFNGDFVTERDILKFARERIVRCDDIVTGDLYKAYLQSAGIDPEKDFKYGLVAARKKYESEQEKS